LKSSIARSIKYGAQKIFSNRDHGLDRSNSLKCPHGFD